MSSKYMLRLVSDGTLRGTRLTHIATGAELVFCKLTLEIDAAHFGEQCLTITIPRELFEVDISTMADVGVPAPAPAPVPDGGLVPNPQGWVPAGQAPHQPAVPGYDIQRFFDELVHTGRARRLERAAPAPSAHPPVSRDLIAQWLQREDDALLYEPDVGSHQPIVLQVPAPDMDAIARAHVEEARQFRETIVALGQAPLHEGGR